MRPRRFHPAASLLALTTVYFLAGKFGLSMAFLNASASPVWPPTGIAMAALLLWGYRLWPAVFLGAFLVNISTPVNWATTVGIATGNTLEAFLGAWLVNQFANGRHFLERARNIFKFILLAVILSTMVSATFGTTSLALGGHAQWKEYSQIWVTWWTGNAIGALIVAPLIVIWCSKRLPRWNQRQLPEAAVILACVVVVAQIGFNGASDAPLSRYLRFFLYPSVLLAAYRFGQFGAINGVFAVACIAIEGTRHGLGPFASQSPNAALLLLQTYLGTLTVTNLILGALVSERKRTEERLRVQEAVSHVLAESSTLIEATPNIIKNLCQITGWDMGAIWRPDPSRKELVCVGVWHVPDIDVPAFESVTRQRTFAPGIGLPGRVWTSGKPEWIFDVADDPNFPRAPMAIKEGLHSGVAFPFKVGGETLGVLECFSRRVREPDQHFLDTLADIGSVVGQFIERRRAEEELRVKEAEFRLITNVTPVMLTRCSRDLRYLFVNPAYAAMLGLKPEQVIGRRIVDVIGPEGFETIRPHVENVLKGQLVEYEDQVPIREAGERLLRAAYLPDKDAQGNVRGWFASINDMTEHRRAEEGRVRSESLQRAILDSALDCIISINQEGKIIEFNTAAENTFGYRRSEALGKSMAKLIIPPRLRERHAQGLAHYLATGEGPVIGKRIEMSAVRADGVEFPVELAIHEIQLRTERIFTATLRDITERKRAEEARAELAAIVEWSEDAIISKNLDGIVTSWNAGAQKMFGYAAAEMIGQSITRIIPPERQDEETVILNRLRRGEYVEHYETVRLKKDGSAVDVSLTISPLRDSSGKVTGAAKIVRDISERKGYALKLEAQIAARTMELRESTSQLEAFVYSVAHDLRAPLRTMQGVAGILLEQFGPVLEEEGRAYAGRIKQSAHFMDRLLLDLLEFSRVSQGQLNLEPVSLRVMLDNALHQYQTEIEAKKARIEVEAPLPSVLAHPATLGQVVTNLLSNALKFAAPDVLPHIRIRAEEKQQSIRFWVEDNGIGIDKEHHERIFRIFERINGTSYTGTGIGLAIVRKGVERMRGSVGVESMPGGGSRFWIELAAGK